MISTLSFVNVADSSGARIAQCIKVLRSKYYHAKLSDWIIVTVKVAVPDRKAKRHSVYKGIIVRLRKTTHRSTGLRIKFNENAVVLFDKRELVMGSRVFGPVAQELRIGKHIKVLSLAASVI